MKEPKYKEFIVCSNDHIVETIEEWKKKEIDFLLSAVPVEDIPDMIIGNIDTLVAICKYDEPGPVEKIGCSLCNHIVEPNVECQNCGTTTGRDGSQVEVRDDAPPMLGNCKKCGKAVAVGMYCQACGTYYPIAPGVSHDFQPGPEIFDVLPVIATCTKCHGVILAGNVFCNTCDKYSPSAEKIQRGQRGPGVSANEGTL